MKLSETFTVTFYDYPNSARGDFERWKKNMLDSGEDVEIVSISQGHGENHADECTARLSISVIYLKPKGR